MSSSGELPQGRAGQMSFKCVVKAHPRLGLCRMATFLVRGCVSATSS